MSAEPPNGGAQHATSASAMRSSAPPNKDDEVSRDAVYREFYNEMRRLRVPIDVRVNKGHDDECGSDDAMPSLR